MSLYTLVKSVLESNGWKVPTLAVASSPDDNLKQAFALANKELVSLSWRKTWPVLVKDISLTLVPGQAEYDLPTDFHHLVNPSVYSISDYEPLKGNLQPFEFIQWTNNMMGPNVPCSAFRIKQRGKKLTIVPTPQSAETVVYFYVTKMLVVGSDAIDKEFYYKDDDVALVDEDLIELGLNWRWRQKKGLDYTAEVYEYKNIVDQRYAQYLALPEFPIGGRYPEQAPLTDGVVQGPIGP